MNELVLAAALTWNLWGSSLFILYPACTVLRVCVNDETCLKPTNTVVDIVQVDYPVERVTATCADGSFWVAVPYPAFTG